VYPELKKLRESGYSLKVLVRVSEEKGVVISTNALSTYQTKLAPTREKTKSRAACKGRSVSLSTAEGRHGQSQMKPDVLLQERAMYGASDFCDGQQRWHWEFAT
jgi:hypothetical protein